MRKYEVLFITYPDYDEEKIATIIQRYQDVVTRGNGTVKSAEKWGKRRLAYEINDLKDGLYILMNFEADSAVAKEMDRLMKIDQDVVRHMISRIDHARRKISPRKPLREPRSEETRVEPSEPAPAVKVVREASKEVQESKAAPASGEVEAPPATAATPEADPKTEEPAPEVEKTPGSDE